MAHHIYSAFGLKIKSDFEIRELRSGVGSIDVRFRSGAVSPLIAGSDPDTALFRVQPGRYLLNISGVARYLVSSGTDILVDPDPSADDNAVRLFLLGSGIGALLHQRNLLALHASAIATPRGAVVFTGVSGSGKSTLAAAFARRGFGTLADDVCAIDIRGIPIVLPGTSCLKVWADALPGLGIDHNDLRPVRLGIKKYFLPCSQDSYPEQIPLHAVYLLQSSTCRQVSLSPIVGLAKIEALIRNTFRRTLLEQMGLAEPHFTRIFKIASAIQMKRLERPRDSFQIDAIVDCLIEDFAK